MDGSCGMLARRQQVIQRSSSLCIFFPVLACCCGETADPQGSDALSTEASCLPCALDTHGRLRRGNCGLDKGHSVSAGAVRLLWQFQTRSQWRVSVCCCTCPSCSCPGLLSSLCIFSTCAINGGCPCTTDPGPLVRSPCSLLCSPSLLFPVLSSFFPLPLHGAAAPPSGVLSPAVQYIRVVLCGGVQCVCTGSTGLFFCSRPPVPSPLKHRHIHNSALTTRLCLCLCLSLCLSHCLPRRSPSLPPLHATPAEGNSNNNRQKNGPEMGKWENVKIERARPARRTTPAIRNTCKQATGRRSAPAPVHRTRRAGTRPFRNNRKEKKRPEPSRVCVRVCLYIYIYI